MFTLFLWGLKMRKGPREDRWGTALPNPHYHSLSASEERVTLGGFIYCHGYSHENG